MAKDPSYVRLANQHVHGMLADITDNGSLWTISGLEVKPFPDDNLDPEAASFVRAKLMRGVLEVASEEEHTEQKEAAEALRSNHAKMLNERFGSDTANVQEASNQDIVRQTQRKIIDRRLDGPADEEADDDVDNSSSSKVPAGKGAS